MVRVTKPLVVGHFDKKTRHAIYSVDIQPGGTRLATGGGGELIRVNLSLTH